MKRLQKCATQAQATNEMYSLAISKFDIPGDPGFPLNSVYAKPSNPVEAGNINIALIFLPKRMQVLDKKNCFFFHRYYEAIFTANKTRNRC